MELDGPLSNFLMDKDVVMKWLHISFWFRLGLSLFPIFFLTACGGGSDGSGVAINSNVAVYSVSVNVYGLDGTLVLQNNSSDELAVSVDGRFIFNTKLNEDSSYNVSVLAQPDGQACRVSNESGTVSDAVNSVSVFCENTLTMLGKYGGGFPANVVIQDQYAYVAADSGLSIVDISDRVNPEQVSFIEIDASIDDVAVSGNYAYLPSSKGITVIDISDPSLPRVVGVSEASYFAVGIEVDGVYAFIIDPAASLRIFDISNPIAPVLLGRLFTDGIPDDVAVSGNYIYVASTGGLGVYDINDPAAPVLVGSYDTGYSHGISVSGSFAYVAGSDGLVVLDISDPSTPTLVSQEYDVSLFTLAKDVVVSGNYAYLTYRYYEGLKVFDISDPTTLNQVGNYGNAFSYDSVAVSDGYAYVTDSENRLLVIDISDPAAPGQVGGYDTAASSPAINVSGNYAYVADENDGLVVVDISDPALPFQVGKYSTDGVAKGVAVSGNYAYVADYDNGLVVIDVSNPTMPTLIGGYDTGFAYDVVVNGNNAYVRASLHGVMIFDISNPGMPTFIGSYDDGSVVDIAVNGNYVYVADYNNGLVVVDVSNPNVPSVVVNYEIIPSRYTDLALNGSYLYLADEDNGLLVYDISVPGMPSQVGSLDDTFWWSIENVDVSGNYVYLAEGYPYHDIVVVDVSDPSAPVEVAEYKAIGTPSSLTVYGNRLYVGEDSYGMEILELYQP